MTEMRSFSGKLVTCDDDRLGEMLAWLSSNVGDALVDPNGMPWLHSGDGWMVRRYFRGDIAERPGTRTYMVRLDDPDLRAMFVLRWM